MKEVRNVTAQARLAVSGLLLADSSRGLDLNIDGVFDFQEKRTRVFHAPFDEGDGEVDSSGHLSGSEVDFSRDGDLMVAAVNAEDSMHLHL